MRRLRDAFRHPFWQAVLLLVAAYLLFTLGVALVPPLLGVRSAPVPQSVVVQYMLIALVGVLLHVSSDQRRWTRFREPLHATLVDDDKKWLRTALLVLVPLLVGFTAYERTRPRVEAPIQLRSIHPAPPSQIVFRGRSITLATFENPMRTPARLPAAVREGARVYYENCVACHGDRLDGRGHYAHGFSPTPLPLAEKGSIDQLQESYLFWRIAKGGPGLPREGAPWSSAMPVWEDYLTEDEIWSVITYLYAQSGLQPRRWETHAEPATGGGH